MRRLAACLLALGVFAGAVVWPGEAATRLYRSRIVRCTDTARSLMSAGVRRAQVRIMNLGNETVFVGEPGALTTAVGWPIHAASLSANIVLTNTTAGLDCMTATTDSAEVAVLEEIE